MVVLRLCWVFVGLWESENTLSIDSNYHSMFLSHIEIVHFGHNYQVPWQNHHIYIIYPDSFVHCRKFWTFSWFSWHYQNWNCSGNVILLRELSGWPLIFHHKFRGLFTTISRDISRGFGGIFHRDNTGERSSIYYLPEAWQLGISRDIQGNFKLVEGFSKDRPAFRARSQRW